MVRITDEIVGKICPYTYKQVMRYSKDTKDQVIEMCIRTTDEYVGNLYIKLKTGTSYMMPILPEERHSVIMWLREQKLNDIL